jgi:cell shape-determining protein MreC
MLHYVLKNAEVFPGATMIVTAGIGGVFASGIPVGTVAAVHRKTRGMFLEIEVDPSVDFQRLEFVQLNLSLQAVADWQEKIDASAGWGTAMKVTFAFLLVGIRS